MHQSLVAAAATGLLTITVAAIAIAILAEKNAVTNALQRRSSNGPTTEKLRPCSASKARGKLSGTSSCGQSDVYTVTCSMALSSAVSNESCLSDGKPTGCRAFAADQGDRERPKPPTSWPCDIADAQVAQRDC